MPGFKAQLGHTQPVWLQRSHVMLPCLSFLIHELRAATASTPKTAVLKWVEHVGERQALCQR